MSQPVRPLDELRGRLEAAGVMRAGVDFTARDRAQPALDRRDVAGIVYDSRLVRPGTVFVAIRGAHFDGHSFLADAARAGAVAAIVEHPDHGVAMPQLVVDDSSLALAEAACWWFGDPSRELGVIGITGTDGKTTTGYLGVRALEAAGVRTGLVGTVAVRSGGVETPNPEHVTTPEAPELQSLLRAMVSAGDEAAIVESTSHGLALGRVAGIAYDIAILTNLSHEHLEFHGSFERYLEAKRSLFERLGREPRSPKDAGGRAWPRTGIVNLDDRNAAPFLAATRAAGARVLTYGTRADADVQITHIDDRSRGLSLAVRTPSWKGRIELRIAGRFNAWNATAILALGEALDLDAEAVRAGLESVERVPGRMEFLDVGQPFGVVIDYAHTPASLESVLDLLSPRAAQSGGGLIAVFGSAGERDRAKRPLMGRVAGERCRLVIVTDEDPRREPSEAILREIAAGAEAAGARQGSGLLLIGDRRRAIGAAFARARPGDVVLLAGKGHERTIIVGDDAIPWDEQAEALAALAELGYSG